MIAIQTKCLPATNTRGPRIKAWTSSGFAATVPYPHRLSYELCHFEAVKELIAKHNLDWNIKNMRYGGTEQGYVFCFDAAVIGDTK